MKRRKADKEGDEDETKASIRRDDRIERSAVSAYSMVLVKEEWRAYDILTPYRSTPPSPIPQESILLFARVQRSFLSRDSTGSVFYAQGKLPP